MQTNAWMQVEKSSINAPDRTQVQTLEQISRPYSVRMVKLVDLKGSIRILPDYDIEELIRNFEVYTVCDRHSIAFLSKKAYKLHLQQEHAH
jgi:hypothetical protein